MAISFEGQSHTAFHRSMSAKAFIYPLLKNDSGVGASLHIWAISCMKSRIECRHNKNGVLQTRRIRDVDTTVDYQGSACRVAN